MIPLWLYFGTTIPLCLALGVVVIQRDRAKERVLLTGLVEVTDVPEGFVPPPMGLRRTVMAKVEAATDAASTPQGCIHAPLACPTCTGCGSDAARQTS